MNKSNKSSGPGKFANPRLNVTPISHATECWQMRIHEKLHDFGKRPGDSMGQAALSRWLGQRDDFPAGAVPTNKKVLTLRKLVNRFLAS